MDQVTSVVLPLAVLGSAASLLWWQHRAETARWRESVAAAERVFAEDGIDAVIAHCRQRWQDDLGFFHLPWAVAWTPGSLRGYFLEGTDVGSWRLLLCDPDGVSKEPRVERPLVEEIPPEAPPEGLPGVPDLWQVLSETVGSPPRAGLRGVELTVRPATGETITRLWLGVEAGAPPQLEPPEAPAFPLLLGAGFRVGSSVELPELRTLERRHWIREADAAFDLLERVLPSGSTIVELRLSDATIDVSIAGSIPAFDGDPPAPFGDLEFDEYGFASRLWWYPRTEPGFGCPTGRPVADVREDFFRARSGHPGGAEAWYSCSPAFTDGRAGAWHFLPS